MQHKQTIDAITALQSKMKSATDNKHFERVKTLVQVINSPKLPNDKIAPIYSQILPSIKLLNTIHNDIQSTMAAINTEIKALSQTQKAPATSNNNLSFLAKSSAATTSQINANSQATDAKLLDSLKGNLTELTKQEATYSVLAEKTWGSAFDKRCPGIRQQVNAAQSASVAQKGTTFNNSASTQQKTNTATSPAAANQKTAPGMNAKS